MGKWAARLAAQVAAHDRARTDGTDGTDKREVLSVLAVTPKGGAFDFVALRGPVTETAKAPETVGPIDVTRFDADHRAFRDRRARLLRSGWAESDAETVAARLTTRDRERDERVSCVECGHYRPGRCGNHRHAGLNASEVGRDLASMLQRCPGFRPAR